MIDKIYDGPYLRRLDNIIQWSEMDVLNRESVSQHSYKVTIFARVLLEDVFRGSDTERIRQFKRECVDHAMFHDWDEALIRRDISHVTKYNKYNGDKIREQLNSLAAELAHKEFDEDGSSAERLLLQSILSPDPTVKKFVKLCDWLAMAFFVRREQKLGNKNMRLEDTTIFNGISQCVAALSDILKEKFPEMEFESDTFEHIKEMVYEQKS